MMMIRSCARPVSSASSAERSADWSIASIITSRESAGVGERRVRVHQLGQEGLVERAPVDADAHRLVVLDRHPHDRLEVLVVALGADVAGVDAVLGQGARGVRVLDQQLVAVVVEVADERHADAQVVELAADLRHGRGGPSLLTVMRTSSDPAWASAATWSAVASASAVSVLVIDWTTIGCATDPHSSDARRWSPRPVTRAGRRVQPATRLADDAVGRAASSAAQPLDVEERDPGEERHQRHEPGQVDACARAPG